ncbi:MAG TPA: hypothetical protein VGC42_16760, partial [Kofleriaceae bacterium]
TCSSQNASSPAGAACTDNSQCRNGTCALGRCVDICRADRDCGAGNNCAVIPSVGVSHALFYGCLPQGGLISWDLPTDTTAPELLVPVPAIASSVELLMAVDDPKQQVGATSILTPNGTRIYARPCASARGECTHDQEVDQFFNNAQRHEPGFGQSILQMPSGDNVNLMPGVYQIEVAAQNTAGRPGTSVPRVTAVLRLDTGVRLDVHLFFLDLADHPCQAAIGPQPLTAATAQAASGFHDEFLGELRSIFQTASLSVNVASYDDLIDHPALDALDVDSVGDLLKYGKYADGINVFFVRSLSPVGVQAYSPNPGPSGVAGTRQSGIVIGLDTLCYRSWTALARLTAHELARYMGLYHNVERGAGDHASWTDQINDTDADPGNLMYFAERLGAGGEPPAPRLSPGQRAMITHSPALQSFEVAP